MVQDVERLRPQIDLHTFAVQRKDAAHKWIERVIRPSTACIAAHHGAVDHGTIRRCTSVTAVRRSCHQVVRQAACERADTTQAQLERRVVDATEHRTMTLVVNCVAILRMTEKVGVVRILCRGIRIDVVQRL